MSEAEMNNNVSHVSKNFIEEENNASTGSSLKVVVDLGVEEENDDTFDNYLGSIGLSKRTVKL